MTDEEILSHILKGNDAGLTMLAEKYEKLLVYIVTGILGSRVRDIEECINDTYLKFWKSASSFDMEKASMSTYLKVIARNTALNRLRDIRRHEEHMISEDFTEETLNITNNAQNIENHIERKEETEHLSRVIAALSDKDKELVIRKYFYLQSSKIIAQAMYMSVTAVDSRLSRLRTKMKIAFDELESA